MNVPSPHPTPEEARASLADIDRIAERVRKAVASSSAASTLILWGVIWAVGFMVTQLFDPIAFRVWLALDGIGVVASLYLGGWFRGSALSDPHRNRIGTSWLILIGYAVIWLMLLLPGAFGRHAPARGLDWGHRIGAFWCEVAMFGYVIMGLWLSPFLLRLGLLVSVLTLAGLILLPGCFYLWMAVMGGGALAAAGLYIRIAWR